MRNNALSVALITRRLLLRRFTTCFCYYSLPLEVILTDTNVLYILFNVSCNHPWRSLRQNASEKINKKLQHQVVFLCAAHWSPLKKDTESINLVYFRSVEEEFRSRTRSRPPTIRDDTLHLCHAHSRIDGLFIACGVCFLLVGANVM